MTADLPKGWESASLRDLGDEVRGSVAPDPTAKYELYSVPTFPSGRPELLRGDQIGSHKRPVEVDDVLLCKINPRINRVWQVGTPGGFGAQIASTEYFVFRAHLPTVARYLRWYFTSPDFRRWIELSVEGATGSHTRAKSGPILAQSVPLPPIAEQERIVAAIEEHLSRLEAAEASLEGCQRRLSLLTASVMGASFELDAPLVSISSVATVGSGATPSRTAAKYWTNGTIPWLTSSAVNHAVISEPSAFITDAALRETSVRLWPPGTVLVAMYGEGRTRGRAAELAFESTCNQACAAITVDETAMRPSFLRWFLNSRYEQSRKLASGGVQPNLSLGLVRSIKVPVPALSEQDRVVAELEAWETSTSRLTEELAACQARAKALRRSILGAAFAGQLVPQDPSDEPASVLLERIRAEREAAGPRRRPRT